MVHALMITGVYAITPDETNTDVLFSKVEAALQGGVQVVQYRNKAATDLLKTQQLQALLPLCRQYHVPFIINDSIELCLTHDTDGVHLGGDDGDLTQARAQLGPGKLLGASCYNRFELALNAQQNGADYVAFGACFTSTTKPFAPLASLDLFKEARLKLHIPAVAIGGITLDNALLAIEAGARSIAVINALFNAPDVKLAAKELAQLFQDSTCKP